MKYDLCKSPTSTATHLLKNLTYAWKGRRCLSMAGDDDDEIFYDKESQRYAKDNRTAVNCTHFPSNDSTCFA